MGIGARYTCVAKEVAEVCHSVGRDPQDVTLIAVSKTVGVGAVAEAVSAGANDFGENRTDSLAEKVDAFPDAQWHFIGNIQSRKIPDIVLHSSVIHSLYQVSHVARIDAAAQAANKVQEVLIEVNVSGEQSKSGLEPAAVGEMVQRCLEAKNIRVRGLMTMAPQGDHVLARECFERLKKLRDEVVMTASASVDPLFMRDLSMGMSEDWREGIAAGATMVRVGRAIFDDTFEYLNN